MRTENFGIRLVNEDDEPLDISLNTEGPGFILKVGDEQWWIDDIGEFASEITKLANT